MKDEAFIKRKKAGPCSTSPKTEKPDTCNVPQNSDFVLSCDEKFWTFVDSGIPDAISYSWRKVESYSNRKHRIVSTYKDSEHNFGLIGYYHGYPANGGLDRIHFEDGEKGPLGNYFQIVEPADGRPTKINLRKKQLEQYIQHPSFVLSGHHFQGGKRSAENWRGTMAYVIDADGKDIPKVEWMMKYLSDKCHILYTSRSHRNKLRNHEHDLWPRYSDRRSFR
jgi:hypothetical protein